MAAIDPVAGQLPRRRGVPVLLAGVLLVAALGGCAYSGPPAAVASDSVPDLDTVEASAVLAQWQQRLVRYIVDEGSGDPAVLADLATLRSPQVLRPGRIVFTASDVGATAPERDGFDVSGLLLGKRQHADSAIYVFVVGTMKRHAYRSVAVADVRLAALSVRDGVLNWQTGEASETALQRYQQHADLDTALRFPADLDDFRLADCAPGLCVEETGSGGRWILSPDAPSTRGDSPIAGRALR